LAAELVRRLKPDVLVTHGVPGTLAAPSGRRCGTTSRLLGAFAQIAALYLVAAWMGTSSPTLPALVLVGCMYPVWRCWRWWRAKRIVEKPTFFEVEYTDNAGCVLRALTPEAQAWAKEHLEPPLPNGDYLVSRATVGIVVAGASERGYLVRLR
jgi:hypothetical protein